jgi:hypothetical protein
MKVLVTDIVYDTRDICDGHQWDQNELDLPSEFTIELVGDNDVENEIADTISDLTGWCVGSYNYEIL